MIPPDDFLEQYYTAEEIKVLSRLRGLAEKVGDSKAVRDKIRQALQEKLWTDELTYIARTTFIITKRDGVQLLTPNYAQRRFYEDVIQHCRREAVPIRGIVLKARQLGFSTFIQAWQYAQCELHPNRFAMTVSYDDPSTEELFGKAKFAHDRRWYQRATKRTRTNTMEFGDNWNSTFFARTAGSENLGRSFTLHHLHCSEIPMWRTPDESLGAVLQAVPDSLDSSVFYESTAKGALGRFYDDWQRASRVGSGFVPFFAPWYWDITYSMEFATPAQKAAFAKRLGPDERKMMEDYGLTLEQMRWRAWVIENKCHGSTRLFRQEYPICAEEAFLTTGKQVFDPDKVVQLQNNATVPLWRGDIIMAAAS